MSEPTPNKDPRGPTNLRIKFRSATLQEFIERYAADVSRGGVFIRTREPLAVGTQLRLELQLQDATPLLVGEGTVIWIRENDPSRQNVTPGMAVRFDKLSPETEPTLEKILEEKSRMEQAGPLPAQPSGVGGMAVRRPSAVLSTLEASGRVMAPASNAPTVPIEVSPPEAAAAPPATPGVSKTTFMASGRGAGSAPAAPGPFTRARNTTTRPVPVPSALFEPPTAADIDKALSVLEEAPGPAPAAPPPSVPRFVPEESSAAPTRVGPLPTPDGATGEPTAPTPLDVEELLEPSILTEEPGPAAPVLADASPTATGERPSVGAPATPEVSRRFRAASKAYPTINRRRGTTTILVLIVVLGAGVFALMKLRPGSSVPAHPVSIPAQGMGPATAPAPSAAPPPAAQPSTPPPAATAPTPPPAAAPPPPAAEKPAAAESAPSGGDRHRDRGSRRHGHEEASARESGSKKTAAAADKGTRAATAPEASAPEAKPAEAKPAEAKPAADIPAAPPPAADKPAAEAKPAATSLLKISSSPSGAEVLIDGNSVGLTPFTSKEIDPGAPHAITVKKDGFETNERMIGTSDWSRPRGSAPSSLRVSVKLRRLAPPPAEPKESAPAPAEDTGGPYIKEVNPSSP